MICHFVFEFVLFYLFIFLNIGSGLDTEVCLLADTKSIYII